MDNFFTKEKFNSLKDAQKHKKVSEILRILYNDLLKKEPNTSLFNHYKLLEQYLNLPPITYCFSDLSNRFHFHLEKAQIFLKEHNLLPTIDTNDRPSLHQFLNIDIFLDNVRSAHNIGSIIRTTEALRIGQIFFSKEMTSFESKKVLDTAMGAANYVDSKVLPSFDLLKRPIIALETAQSAISIYDFIFPSTFSLLLGNEEYGLSNQSLEKADIIVKIPLYGFKNSLNVACAYSLVAGEIRRQHVNS